MKITAFDVIHQWQKRQTCELLTTVEVYNKQFCEETGTSSSADVSSSSSKWKEKERKCCVIERLCQVYRRPAKAPTTRQPSTPNLILWKRAYFLRTLWDLMRGSRQISQLNSSSKRAPVRRNLDSYIKFVLNLQSVFIRTGEAFRLRKWNWIKFFFRFSYFFLFLDFLVYE